MPRRLLTFALGLLAALLPVPAFAQGAPASPATWSSFTPPEGIYTVQAPGTQERIVTPITEPPGAPGQTVLYRSVVDRKIYLTGWADYTPTFNFDVQAEIDANRDNFVKGVGGTLLGSKPVTMNGAPGVEFTAEKPGVWFVRARIYVVGRRPIQAIILVPADQRGAPEIERFLASFKSLPAR